MLVYDLWVWCSPFPAFGCALALWLPLRKWGLHFFMAVVQPVRVEDLMGWKPSGRQVLVQTLCLLPGAHGSRHLQATRVDSVLVLVTATLFGTLGRTRVTVPFCGTVSAGQL